LADPNTHKNKFRKDCILEPPSRLDAADLRGKWKPGFLTHKVKVGESIGSIARYYGTKGTGPQGLDWRMVSRYNWGVDHPPYINWCLVEAYDFDEAKNLTKDHKNYHFKGGEELLIPLAVGAPKPGRIAPNSDNRLDRRKIEVGAVNGPSLMTPDIKSEFKVTGYTSRNEDIPDDARSRVKWKIKDLDDGSETDAAETGETVKLTFAAAKVGHRIQVYPYLEEVQEAVYCELRVIKVELKHEIPIGQMDAGNIAASDPINHIHNPAAVMIGADQPETAARFRLTKVEPAAPGFVLAPNDPGFVWRIRSDQGGAKFVQVDRVAENTGCDCLVAGVKPGLIRLEGWTAEAEKACVWLTVKVVNERQIRYRANFFERADGAATVFTPSRVSDAVKLANIHMRQIGMTFVPDSDASAGAYLTIGTDGPNHANNVEAVGGAWRGTHDYAAGAIVRGATAGLEYVVTTAGRSGASAPTWPTKAGETVADGAATWTARAQDTRAYFKVKKIKNKYFRNVTDADAQVAACINARSGVVTFNFARSGASASTGGMAPGSPPNLHTQPAGHGTAAMTGVPDTFEGPDETVKPDDTASFKDLTAFGTPETPMGSLRYGGIIVYGITNNETLREQGAILAHEFGHVAAVMHRGDGNTDGNAGDDGLPGHPPDNVMDPFQGNNGRTDLDLLQLEMYRGTWLAERGGGLTVRPVFTRGVTKVSGKKNDVKTVSVEVVRRGKRVTDAVMNFFLLPHATGDIQIDKAEGWDKATRKAEKGYVKLKVKLNGDAGKTAKVLVMAGDNDDLACVEIDCEITA
jgi:hypothetical protein